MTDDEDLEMIGGKVWLIVAITMLAPGIVGCAYEDYLEASAGKMPDRWWKTLQKLN